MQIKKQLTHPDSDDNDDIFRANYNMFYCVIKIGSILLLWIIHLAKFK